ncbi:hypothetical protein MK489_14565 [Myxococcota bacterium]|nr:hypothetical protein [Myxococcota bacterium]
MNLLWAFDDHVHHDIEVLEDGGFYVLTSHAEIVERINLERPILHDSVVLLDANGREIDRFVILEAIENSDFTPLLDQAASFGDRLHTNEIHVLDGPPQRFEPAGVTRRNSRSRGIESPKLRLGT